MSESDSPTLTSSNGVTELGRLISCRENLESYVITKQPFKIGRSKHCDIVLEITHLQNFVSNVSKEHFVLTKDPQHDIICLTDVSKNGTFINGKKVGRYQKIPLKDASKIAVGHLHCTVFIYRTVFVEELLNTLSPLSLTCSGDTSDTVLPMWGRLISCMCYLKSIDLTKPILKVGRSSTCDVVIDKTEIKDKLKQVFSKEHFSIFKDSENLVTYITDYSKSGTFLNGDLIGKGNSYILQHDDIISIGTSKIKIFLYKCMYSQYCNDLPPKLKKKYEPTKLLGKGAVGEVRLVFEKNTCKMYAIKKILKTRSTTSQLHKMNHPNKIRSEISILQNLSHPFIIHLKDIEETPDEVFIVLEYMEGGELTNRILSTVPLSESNIKFLFYQMVLAVEYLHGKGITHRDLKPENVLLASDDMETLVKVSDFGLSKITDEDSAMKTVCGTLYYIAPEVLDSPEYNKQVDIWSLGVILFYMLSKQLPFRSTNKVSMANLIKAGDYKMDKSWDLVSDNAKDLVQKMLIVNPLKRITINEIQKHPWLAEDTNMQNKVNALLDSNVKTEETTLDSIKEPSPKRIRLSESDD